VLAHYELALPALRMGVVAESRQLTGSRSLRDFNWRLDVRLASRATQREAAPSFLLHFVTSRADGAACGDGPLQSTWMESDYATLAALSLDVDLALKKSAASSRRISRLMSAK
jgi:hypothetical protein